MNEPQNAFDAAYNDFKKACEEARQNRIDLLMEVEAKDQIIDRKSEDYGILLNENQKLREANKTLAKQLGESETRNEAQRQTLDEYIEREEGLRDDVRMRDSEIKSLKESVKSLADERDALDKNVLDLQERIEKSEKEPSTKIEWT